MRHVDVPDSIKRSSDTDLLRDAFVEGLQVSTENLSAVSEPVDIELSPETRLSESLAGVTPTPVPNPATVTPVPVSIMAVPPSATGPNGAVSSAPPSGNVMAPTAIHANSGSSHHRMVQGGWHDDMAVLTAAAQALEDKGFDAAGTHGQGSHWGYRSEPASAHTSRAASPTVQLLGLPEEALVMAMTEACRHGQPKPTKATIRVPARAVRLLLKSGSMLKAFQQHTQVSFVTCCSETHPTDGVAEILVRGTRDAVVHATAAMEHLGKVILPRLEASMRNVGYGPGAGANPSVHVAEEPYDDHVGVAHANAGHENPNGSHNHNHGHGPNSHYRRQSISAPMSPAATRSAHDSRVPSSSVPQSPRLSRRSASTQSIFGPTTTTPEDVGDMKAFVFIDNSNIFIGAQLDGNVRDLAVRVNIRTLCEVVEGGLPCAYRAVTGTAAANSRIWHEWENNEYHVFLSSRQGGSDDALHAAISEQLRIHHHQPQILVLATGDGNESGQYGSFPQLAETALQAGWDVRIWSWEQSLSGKFRDLIARYAERIKISFLDPFKQHITFKAGQSPNNSPRSRRRMSVPDDPAVYLLARGAPYAAMPPGSGGPGMHGPPTVWRAGSTGNLAAPSMTRRNRHSFDLSTLRQDMPTFPAPSQSAAQGRNGGWGQPTPNMGQPPGGVAWVSMGTVPERDDLAHPPASGWNKGIW